MRIISFKAIITLLMFFIIINSTYSQHGATIKGVVNDITLAEKMIGANVYLEGTSIGSVTNADGEYIIRNVPKGNYVLTVSYIGYNNSTESISVSGNEIIEKNIDIKYSGAIGMDEIVVTVQAKGQYKAINDQLNAKTMKNVVSSERIQELPDANAAEALGRLPGITLERSGGEGQKVIIRGLSPKYTKVMINGIEMPSNSAGFNEYNNDVSSDRSADLSMISPFSLGGIEVIKSPTAEQDADFIGGMVNFKLRTAPIGFKADVLAEGSYNNLKDTYSDYNLNFSVSNRFFDNKFGLFFQANAEQRNRSSNEASIYYEGLDFNKVSGPYDYELTPYNKLDSLDKILNDVLKTTKRYGATAVFDYLIPNGKIVFSNIINSSPSRTTSHEESYGIPYRNNTQHFGMRLTDVVSNSNTTIISNTLQYEQSISNFDLDASFSHSFSSVDNTRNSIGAYNNNPPEGGDPQNPMYIDYPFMSTNVSGINNDISLNEQRQFEGAVNISWNFVISSLISGSIKTGGKLRIRDKKYDLERMFVELGSSDNSIRLEAKKYFPDIKEENGEIFNYEDIVDDNYVAHEFLKGDFVLGPRAMVDFIEDFPTILADNNFQDQRYYNYLPISQLNDYSGTENWKAAYILAELNITKKFTMIPGIRIEQNTTEYNSFTGENEFILGKTKYIIDTNTTTRNNTFILPNLQLKYEPTEWAQLRFGYSNTLARPSYNSLLPRTIYYPNRNPRYVSSNNSNLKPEESTNFDFMVSVKQNHIGLFTVGAFYKDIENKIYRRPRTYIHNPEDYGLDPYYTSLYNTNQILTDVNNANMTKIRGLEFDLQTSFWYLPGALKGLVLNTNYTYTHSETVYELITIDNKLDPITFEPIVTNISTFYADRIPGQAAHSTNISLGYDYKGFSARVSMNHVSDISKGPSKFVELRKYSLPLTRWDFSIKQNLFIPGFQLYANINNITKAVERNIQNKTVQYLTNSYYYGRTITVGVRWRIQ